MAMQVYCTKYALMNMNDLFQYTFYIFLVGIPNQITMLIRVHLCR